MTPSTETEIYKELGRIFARVSDGRLSAVAGYTRTCKLIFDNTGNPGNYTSNSQTPEDIDPSDSKSNDYDTDHNMVDKFNGSVNQSNKEES